MGDFMTNRDLISKNAQLPRAAQAADPQSDGGVTYDDWRRRANRLKILANQEPV